MTGFISSAFISSTTAGSFPLWDGIRYSFTPGNNLSAVSAAAMLINPSSTTGIRQTAPPIHTPASPAMSSPPTVRNISNALLCLRSYFSMLSCMTSLFFLNPSSFSPAPLPVTRSASQPNRAATTALLVVVFPIPISPVAII